ncbi:unnamed protein product [Ectocarpus sp. 12 AP-2014]
MSASKREGDRSCVDGFEIEIFKLVKEGATPEQWKEWLRTPLEHAAASGNLDLFTRLMDAGADGEAGWRGCDGRTLLGAAACGNNSDKMVRALLEAGARSDVNVLFGAKCESALHVAAARGTEKTSTALMIAGADPNLRDREGSSPLHRAAEAGHDGVVGSLLLKGAQVDAQTHVGRTPLHLAASEDHTLCISELLLGGAEKDVVDGNGETPLFTAAANNHRGGVEKLLAAGANGGIRANNDYSPLEIAASSGDATIVKVFLDEDSSAVDATDNLGWTALHCCATAFEDNSVGDNGDAVRVLLEAGADVDAKTTTANSCSTPLHIAVARRMAPTGTIRALLEGGANVNVRDEVNETPLHTACKNSSVTGVELLLVWGADEKLTDDNGHTPADVIGDSEKNGNNDEEIEVDNNRVRRMLARAPTDRSWRRRGWLVLSRSCPTRVQIVNSSSSGICIGSSKVCTAKVARVSGEDSGGDDEEAEDQVMVDWRGLVGRLVGLEADGLFRLVVGFL